MLQVSANDAGKRFFIALRSHARAPEGLETVSLPIFLEAVEPDYRESLQETIEGESHRPTLTMLAESGLTVVATQALEGGVLCQLTPLEDLQVPPGLDQQVLGVRREAIHDVCNDLAAARLNGELALRLLDQNGGVVDPEVTDAVRALVRVSVEVEERLRELQQNLNVNRSGKVL